MAVPTVVAAEMPTAAWGPAIVFSILGLVGAVYVIAQSAGWKRQVLVATATSHSELAYSQAAEVEVRAQETALYLNKRWKGRLHCKDRVADFPRFVQDYPYNYAIYYLLSSEGGPHHQALATSERRLRAYWEGVLHLVDKELLPVGLLKDLGKPWVVRGEAYRVLAEPLAMAAFMRHASAFPSPPARGARQEGAPLPPQEDYLHVANRPLHFRTLQLHHRQRVAADATELDTAAMQTLLTHLRVAREARLQGWRASPVT